MAAVLPHRRVCSNGTRRDVVFGHDGPVCTAISMSCPLLTAPTSSFHSLTGPAGLVELLSTAAGATAAAAAAAAATPPGCCCQIKPPTIALPSPVDTNTHIVLPAFKTCPIAIPFQHHLAAKSQQFGLR